MSNMIKRVLAMALVLAMVLSFVPAIAQIAQAATTTDTSGFTVADLGITVTDANGSGTPTAEWTAIGSGITGSLVGGVDSGGFYKYYYESTTSITLTNNKTTEADLTFTYSATTTGSAYGDITVNGTTHTASVADQTVTITLAAGGSTTITLHVPQRRQALSLPTANGASISIHSISLVSESATEVTFGAAEGGSYTAVDANGNTVTVPGTVATTSTTRYTLTATPASGHAFAGWYATDAAGVSTFLSGSTTFTTGFEESVTVAPRFIASSDAIYGVGEAVFSDLALALSTANNSSVDKVVVVLKDTTISGSYTVPAGVTLLVPYDAAHTVGGEDPADVTQAENKWTKPQAYVTLTMASGASLAVNGKLEVGARHIVCQGHSSRIYGGGVYQYYGCIDTASGAQITVNSGGTLYAWGYIIGDGTVTANSGATVYEKMQVTDYRGGTNTSLLITGATFGTNDAFPFCQYYVQNVEVKETLNPGASLKVHASVYDSGDNLASAVVSFIGGSGAMFTTGGNTRVVKEYDASTDRMTISAIGDGASTSTISLGSMSLSLGTLSINSARYVLPINSNLDIRFEGITATTNQELLLQPGATVYVAQDAVLATNEKVHIFDIDQWGAYIFSEKTCSPVQFAPGLGGASKRTISSDAVVDINGVVNVIAGVYSTSGGAQVISSEGTGRINYNAAAPGDSSINQITGGRDVTDVAVTSAILTNGDGSTTLTAGAASGDYFVYSDAHDMWLLNGVAPAVTYTVQWFVDGAAVETDTVEEGIAPEYNGAVPSKAADAMYTYTFAGWDADGDHIVDSTIGGVTGDMIISAVFTETIRTYDVVFYDEDGTTVLYTAEDVPYGQVPDYSGIIQKNDGCYYYNIELPPVGMVDGTDSTLSYTVSWLQGEPVVYTITWVVDDESIQETIPYGETPIYSGNTDKEGDENTVYTFVGWEPAITTVTGDATYTAVYDVHTHNYVGQVVAEPGCESSGTMEYSCSCGIGTYTESIPAVGHSYEAATTAPDCTVGGYTTYVCSTCGDSYVSDEVPATGHSYEAVVTAPTCETAGYTTYTCSACGDSYVADEVAALGHSYESVTVDATCTEDGSITYTCACGDSYVETIPAIGHSYEAVVTAPTCTEAGYTTYTCANCGDSYVADEVAALGHSYESVTVDATCTEDGSVTYTCSACGDSYVETIPATGHSYEAVVTAPTCETAGYTTYTCANCGDSYVADEVAALGHSYESVTVEATCTEDGSVTYTCSACGDSYVETIPATGHSYEAVITAPTCETAGYTTYTCANCGDSYVADEVAALGHSYESVTVEATCTEDGSITYTCACGDSYVETIPATGHSYEAVVTAPTCETAGYTTYTCANCGDSYVGDEVAATGHSYVDGICTVCGAEDPNYVALFDLYGSNVNLGNDLTMNFYVQVSDINGEAYYIEIVKEYDDGSTVTTTIPYAQWESYYGVMWKVSLEGMAAKEMADKIYVTVYTTAGVQVSNTWTDSIRDYCIRQLNSPAQSKAYTLLADMLNYGAAAQTQFGYNTDDLANSTMTADQKAYATQDFNLSDYENNQVKGTNYIGSSLSLETNIQLTIYFNKLSSSNGLKAVVSYTDHLGEAKSYEVAEADFTTLAGVYYGVVVDTLVAADVYQVVSVSLYDGDTLVGNASDSMESYAVRQSGDINIALMKFALSAYKFLR